MPWYTVGHTCPLTKSQKDQLAAAITNIHSQHFTAHKIFVNVRFEDVSHASTYVGGRPLNTNRIIAAMRGGSRTRESMEQLCGKIVQAWDEIVKREGQRGKAAEDDDDHLGPLSLHAISVQASIAAGYEAGLYQPAPGGDQEWYKTHRDRLEDNAKRGDTFAKFLLEDAAADSNFT